MNKITQYQTIFSQRMEYSAERLLEILVQVLNEKRYQHVIRVLETSYRLMAQFFGDSIESVRITKAVLFHDLAKGMTPQELTKYASLYGISLSGVLAPVYHAVVGAWIASYYFGIEDQEILDAIYYHTTGSDKFLNNPIGAILYLADYLEPGRAGDYTHIRQIEDLNLSMRAVIKDKICYVIQQNKILDQESLSFYHTLIHL
ncbi:MAG: bis(5'-nucleosyl)-tetraphosphatase (symmetrical) YqeK [Brevinema sp.]